MSADRQAENLASLCFIYCLDRLADGSYVALNRHYKPIGYTTKDWLDYEALPVRFNFKAPPTSNDLAALSCEAHPSADRIYLYRGKFPLNHADWAVYAERLKILASLAVTVA